MAKIDLLCRGLMSQNHGPGPWDRGPIPQDFQQKNNLIIIEK
jgi:hypothetical protein